jgi:hypothetical protein
MQTLVEVFSLPLQITRTKKRLYTEGMDQTATAIPEITKYMKISRFDVTYEKKERHEDNK